MAFYRQFEIFNAFVIVLLAKYFPNLIYIAIIIAFYKSLSDLISILHIYIDLNNTLAFIGCAMTRRESMIFSVRQFFYHTIICSTYFIVDLS